MVNNANVYLPGTIQIPSALEITAITNANPMVITISVDAVTASNTYQAGQLVRLNIPYEYGMFQANGQVGQVIDVIGSNITVDIDSTHYDIFSIPGGGEQPASLAPAGSKNLQYNNTTRQVPFQSLNNIGN